MLILGDRPRILRPRSQFTFQFNPIVLDGVEVKTHCRPFYVHGGSSSSGKVAVDGIVGVSVQHFCLLSRLKYLNSNLRDLCEILYLEVNSDCGDSHLWF